MYYFSDTEHIRVCDLIGQKLLELSEQENWQACDVENEFLISFWRKDGACEAMKKAIAKLIDIFRFYLTYISESLTVFNMAGYDKVLSIIPPPKMSKEELQQVLADIYHDPEKLKLADYQEIYFNRKEIEYIFETVERRASGHFLPTINEELLAQNTQQAKTIEIQNNQIKALEKQAQQNQSKTNTVKSIQSAKSNNAMVRFIKALLTVHYGADVAENPRKHIAEFDSSQGVKYANGKIQKDFDRLGYEVGISGRTLQNWLDGVPLPKENGLGKVALS